MTEIATTAAEAHARYEAALAEGRLIRKNWQSQSADGRHLACALGVLGPNVRSAADCPASVMPRWLARLVPYFFDGQPEADAFIWGQAFYVELERLGGQVPFTVIYDWHGTVLAPAFIERAEARGAVEAKAAHEAYRDLHLRALGGDRAPREAWREVTAKAYADADADAYADAYADADAYAYAYADAYADADAYAYAYAYAYADAGGRRAAVKRQADGMLDCLRRVQAPVV